MSEYSLQATDWQPIETAPKDGTCFLGYAIKEAPDMMPQIARWMNGQFVLAWDGTLFGVDQSPIQAPLTHWMPLPFSPEE